MTSLRRHALVGKYVHSTVVSFFQINEFNRGKSIWKFNYCLFNDMEYIKTVIMYINTVINKYSYKTIYASNL